MQGVPEIVDERVDAIVVGAVALVQYEVGDAKEGRIHLV